MARITADLSFTFISMIFDAFVSFISLFILIIIMHHLCTKRTKKQEKITFILNSYAFLFVAIYAIIAVSFCFNTILGQLYGYNYQSTGCMFNGYYFGVVFYALYSVFVSQAVYRLGRIVYPSHKWLQRPWFYTLIGPFHLIMGTAILLPLFIRHDYHYLPSEHYCLVSVLHLGEFIYNAAAAYGVPFLVVFFIYFRIIVFLHYQSTVPSRPIQHREQRDLLAIRRINITIVILLITKFPCIILLIVANITGVEQPYTYRIEGITASISLVVLCITIVKFTSRLRRVVMSKWHRNRVQVMTAHGRPVLPIVAVATVQTTTQLRFCD